MFAISQQPCSDSLTHINLADEVCGRDQVETPYYARPKGSVSKLNTWRDGFRILFMIVNLYRAERPLSFFTAIGVLLAAASIGFAIPIIVTYLETGLVPRLPTAVLATGLMLLAFLSTAVGFILDTVTRGRREMKLLAYLSHRAPARNADKPESISEWVAIISAVCTKNLIIVGKQIGCQARIDKGKIGTAIQNQLSLARITFAKRPAQIDVDMDHAARVYGIDERHDRFAVVALPVRAEECELERDRLGRGHGRQQREHDSDKTQDIDNHLILDAATDESCAAVAIVKIQSFRFACGISENWREKVRSVPKDLYLKRA